MAEHTGDQTGSQRLPKNLRRGSEQSEERAWGLAQDSGPTCKQGHPVPCPGAPWPPLQDPAVSSTLQMPFQLFETQLKVEAGENQRFPFLPRAGQAEVAALASLSAQSHANRHGSKESRNPNFTPWAPSPAPFPLIVAPSISVPISNQCCSSPRYLECFSLLSCLSPLHSVILSC